MASLAVDSKPEASRLTDAQAKIEAITHQELLKMLTFQFEFLPCHD